MVGMDEEVGAIDTTATPEDACLIAFLNEAIATELDSAQAGS